MVDGNSPGADLAAGRPPDEQRRPLTAADRALLHRVIGLADGKAGYAYTMRPGMRDVLGDGTQPQARDLTPREREGVHDMILLVESQFSRRRLPGGSLNDGSLTGREIARLHLIGRIVSPSGRYPLDDQVLVNAEDWEPPVKNPGRMEDCQLTGAARRADHLGRRRPSREVLRSIAFLGVGPPGW